MIELLEKARHFCWYALIAVLPISSMPIIARALGSDSVASPAIFFLAVLLLIWFFPNLLNGRRFSFHIYPLLLFCIVAIAATFLSLFYPIPAFKGIDQFSPLISALGTLSIGLLFFITASSFLKTDKERDVTLKIINWSGFVMLTWCAAQAFAWQVEGHYPQWMFNFQGLLSSRVLYRQRVNGFALEPSWLAHQLNMFYLPIWLACSLNKISFHKFRIWIFSFENILLAGGVFALLLTLSRVGLLAFICVLTLVVVILHGRIVRWLVKSLSESKLLKLHQANKRMISALLLLGYVAVIAMGLFIFSEVDPRMARLFDFSFNYANPLLSYFNELKFGDRVIYWLTGWNIFNEYPLLGVGLGNAGFFFPKNIPAYGWTLIEVERLINRTSILLNIKSLWVRLLAETGIAGFSFFIGWLVSLVPILIKKIKSKDKKEIIFGMAGCFLLAAMVFEGFSIDSFAMPYWWVSLGLAVAGIDSANGK